MISKLLLALVALAIVAAVAFVQSNRTSTRVSDSFKTGFAKGSAEAQAHAAAVDSALNRMEAESRLLRDSIARLTTTGTLLDSALSEELDQKEKTIDSLKRIIKQASRPKSAAKPSTKPTAGTSNRQQEILVYYRKRLDKLPVDLSAYERQIALAEIKSETARLFGISLAELDRLQGSGSQKN